MYTHDSSETMKCLVSGLYQLIPCSTQYRAVTAYSKPSQIHRLQSHLPTMEGLVLHVDLDRTLCRKLQGEFNCHSFIYIYIKYPSGHEKRLTIRSSSAESFISDTPLMVRLIYGPTDSRTHKFTL